MPLVLLREYNDTFRFHQPLARNGVNIGDVGVFVGSRHDVQYRYRCRSGDLYPCVDRHAAVVQFIIFFGRVDGDEVFSYHQHVQLNVRQIAQTNLSADVCRPVLAVVNFETITETDHAIIKKY